MTIETRTDDELIQLWDNLTAQINQGQTAVATSGIRVLSQIHMILAERGYRPQDGIWVKDDETETEVVDEPVAKAEAETETVDEPVAKAEAETETVDEPIAKTDDALEGELDN